MKTAQSSFYSGLRLLFCAALVLLACPVPGNAHALGRQECSEGADYIRNAALSRDKGMSEASFLAIFDQDLKMLQVVPPSLRWFVQDEEDAAFLRSALYDVFRHPKSPDLHAENFAEACFIRAGEWDINGRVRI